MSVKPLCAKIAEKPMRSNICTCMICKAVFRAVELEFANCGARTAGCSTAANQLRDVDERDQ